MRAPRRAPRIALAFLCCLAAASAAAANPPDSSRLAPLDFSRTVFATADRMPAPVAFATDERGAVWTANSLRFDGHGLFDNRAYPIAHEDVTITSAEDRRRRIERWVRTGTFDRDGRKVTPEWLAGFSEQVRKLEDEDGDGRADRVTIAAAGMNELDRGGIAGVLAWDGRVFATAAPELFALDAARPGARTVIQSGFGIHVGQAGHELHGLTMGNDGRIYWSMADRGYDLVTREGLRLSGHDGAVFRCWPDGSGLERFARGLRNPQELAFNDAGDLFTGDNNADVGDRSRLLYLPEGANAGWTFYLQYVPGCGPWTREHAWETRFDALDPARPASVLPPVAHVATCPAGFAAYPGTGLPARYDGTLWLVDYFAGVQTFRPVPEGAGYGIADLHWGFRDTWGLCDAEFGYDGKLRVLYWGESWHINPEAKLVTLTPPSAGVDTAAVAEVRRLVRDGLGALDDARVRRLLAHADRRIRQRASFELARRGAVGCSRKARSPRSATSERGSTAAWGLEIAGHARGADSLVAPAPSRGSSATATPK